MMLIGSIWDAILDALFPLSPEERAIAALAPEDGLREFPSAPPYDSSVASLPGARSVFAYQDPRVSRLVWNIKYKKDRHAADIAAAALYEALKGMNGPSHRDGQAALGPSFIVIPMPSTPRRRRERGYNQCEFLAEALLRVDMGRMLAVESGLLRRIHHSSHQKLKGRAERLGSAKGIFEADPPAALRISSDERLRSARMIVLDDVITTGTTMKEAIDELRKAGFDATGLSIAH